MLKHLQIFEKELKRTANYDLANTPRQGLVVFGRLDINFQTYFQFEFLVMWKHVQAMYKSSVMMTHVYNTSFPMSSL